MAKILYWVAESDDVWTSTNWSNSDGGGAGGSIPGVGDTAIFTAFSSTSNCTAAADIYVLKFDMQDDYTGTFDANDYDLYITGDFLVGSGATWTLSASSQINLTGTIVSSIRALPRVDPIILNRSDAGQMTQTGHVHTSGLTLTDGIWLADTYNLTTHSSLAKGPDGFNLGTGTTTVYDNFDITGANSINCSLIFADDGILTFDNGHYIDNLKINSGVTCTSMVGTLTLYLTGELDLLANATLDVKGNKIYCQDDCDVYIRSSANYTGTDGSLLFKESNSGHGLLLNDGTYNSDLLRFFECGIGTVMANGVYNCTLLVYGDSLDSAIKPDAGIFNIGGNVAINHTTGGTITFEMTNDPTWRVEGYFTYSGGITSSDVNWVVSDETLELVGSAIQYYGWDHEVGNIIIDNSGGDNVVLDGLSIHCKSLTGIDGGLSTNNKPVTIEGNCILDFDSLITGTETWNLYGNFDWKDVDTWTIHTATNFTMNGTNKYLLGNSTKNLSILTIPNEKSAYIHASTATAVGVATSANISGTLTVNSSTEFHISGTANMQIETTGVVAGTGDVIFLDMESGKGLILIGSYTYNVSNTTFYDPHTASLIPVGTYDGNVKVLSDSGTNTWTPGTGTYDFQGFLTLEATAGQTLNVDCRTNQPAFNIKNAFNCTCGATGGVNIYNNHASLDINYTLTGNIDSSHFNGFNWYKGTGTLNLMGLNNVSLDLYDNDLEDIDINKSGGTLTLNYHCNPASLTLTSGNFDANDFDITITDNFEMTSGFDNCECGVGTWDVGGDFSTVAVTTNKFLAELSEIKLTGSGNLDTYCSGYINDFHKLTVSGTYTIPTSTTACTIYEGSNGWLKITDGGTLTCNDVLWIRGDNNLIVETGGKLTIWGSVYSFEPTSGKGVTNNGIIEGWGNFYFKGYNANCVATSGNYDTFIYITGGTELQMGAGTWITKDFVVEANDADFILDMDTNDPTVNTTGDIWFDTITAHELTINRSGTTNDWSVSGGLNAWGGSGTYDYIKGSANFNFIGSGNCMLNAEPLDLENIWVNKAGPAGNILLLDSLTCTSLKNVDGTFDALTSNITVGDVDWNADFLYMGTGTWTCSGNFNVDNANVTVAATTVTLIMTGVNKTLGWRYGSPLQTLDIDTDASITWTISVEGSFGYIRDLNVDGTLKITSGDQIMITGVMDINASGIVGGDGNGNIWLKGDDAADGIKTYAGSLNINKLYIHPQAEAATALLPIAGTYTCSEALYFHNTGAFDAITVLGAGPYVFDTSNVYIQTISTGNMTVDNTANANITFNGGVQDDATSTGARVWLKGTGLVTFAGSGAHTVEWNMGEVEDIDIDCVGSYTLADHLYTESFTMTAGTWDADAYDTIISGDFDLDGGTLNAGDGTWTISGNADFNGGGTMNRDTSKFIFNGSSVTVLSGYTDAYMHKVEFATAFNGNLTGRLLCRPGTGSADDIVINGTVNTTTITSGIIAYYNSDIIFGASADYGGSGIFGLKWWNGNWTLPGGTTFDPIQVDAHNCRTGMVFPARDFASDSIDLEIRLGDSGDVFEFPTGNTHFDNVNIYNNDTVNGNITLQTTSNFFITGNLDIEEQSSGNILWSSNGTTYFSGTGDVSANMNNVYVGNLQVLKSSGVILDSDLNAESLTLTTGNFDANDFNVTLVNDFLMQNSLTCLCGSGTWDIGGNFNTVAVTTNLFLTETSEIKLTGSGDLITYCDGFINEFHKLTISGSYIFTAASNRCIIYEGSDGWLKIVTGGTLISEHSLWVRGSNDWIIENGGKLTANSSTYSYMPESGYGITNDGIIDGVGNFNFWGHKAGTIASSGNYSVDQIYMNSGSVASSRLKMGAGNWITKSIKVVANNTNFVLDMTNDPTINSSGDILFDNATANQLTIDRTGTANDWSIEGDFTRGAIGTYIYIKGTANLNFDGSATQEYDCEGFTLENVWVDKSAGVLTLLSTLDADSLTISDGDFDANDFNVTVGPNDTDWSTDGVISMGAGSTWALSGNFDYSSFSGTLNEETSLVIMDGASKTIEGNNLTANTLCDANIDGTITTAGSGYIYQDGDLHINDTLTLTGQNWRMRDSTLATWTGGVYVNGGGEITGTGQLRMDRAASGGGLLSTTGDLTLGLLTFAYAESTGVFPAYDYSTVNEVRIIQSSPATGPFNWQNGAYTFNNIILRASDAVNFTIDGRTNTPTSITIEGDLAIEALSTGDVLIYNNHASQAIDWIVQGDVTLTEPTSGEVVWTKGTGGIDFTGTTANQAVNLDVNGTLEEFTVDKSSGKITFTGNWDSESFLAVNGTLDFNGQTVQTTGDFIINAANGVGVDVISDADAMNAVDITVGNDFYISNITLNATNTWYLDVQGSSALAFNVTVRYSNANAGTTINPFNSEDLGMNYNWAFELPGEALSSIHSMSFYCFPWTRLTNRSVRGNRRI